MITLATLANSTKQEVFEQVKQHLLAQNKRAINDRNTCQYKIGELKCAAGCLISDDEYTPEFENNSWRVLQYRNLVPETHSRLIQQLQKIHDRHQPKDWPRLLNELEKTI